MERSVISQGRPRRYQRHSIELKRKVVEETLVAGASVARIARNYGINANQIFGWRNLYRKGQLNPTNRSRPELLAVTVADDVDNELAKLNSCAMQSGMSIGHLKLESPKGCLTIEGKPDTMILHIVLKGLLG